VNKGFDIAARVLSSFSLIGSTATLLFFFLAPARGLQFITHIMLIIMMEGQVAVFLVCVVVAVILAGLRGGLHLTRPGAILIIIATTALIAQFFAVQNMPVDSSSIP
jgi:hypothetical protein